MIEKTSAKEDDLLFFGAGKTKIVNDSMGALRAKIGEDLDLFNKDWAPLWVVDFPMLRKMIIVYMQCIIHLQLLKLVQLKT